VSRLAHVGPVLALAGQRPQGRRQALGCVGRNARAAKRGSYVPGLLPDRGRSGRHTVNADYGGRAGVPQDESGCVTNSGVGSRDLAPRRPRRTSLVRITHDERRGQPAFEKEPVPRALPAENSVLVWVLALKHTVLGMSLRWNYGCRSITACPLLLCARAAVHPERCGLARQSPFPLPTSRLSVSSGSSIPR
jgi:hypothetical protein